MIKYTKYLYWNDLDDFKIPYKLHGKIDKQLMLEKYNKLTNKPKNYLHVRCHQAR